MPNAADLFTPPPRRRLYLMRHGAVDYFLPDGTPLPPHEVPLNAAGRAQADAAGALFAAAGVVFDRVVVSGLPRTLETARRVLAACGQSGRPIDIEPDFEEIRPGRLSSLAPEQLREAFTGAFAPASGETGTKTIEQRAFLGGETIGALLDRVLPAMARLQDDAGWQTALLVLHGGVNRALLSGWLCGGRAFLGRLEQSPACINIVDLGPGGQDAVLRAVNLSPTDWLQPDGRTTTMERLLAQYAGGLTTR